MEAWLAASAFNGLDVKGVVLGISNSLRVNVLIAVRSQQQSKQLQILEAWRLQKTRN